MFFPIIISVIIVSSISLFCVIFLAINLKTLRRMLLWLISFAAGTLLGDAFIHLLPQISNTAGASNLELSSMVLAGIILFFFIEKFIHWRHCHIPTSEHHPHPLVWINFVGDGLHNFLDGVIIAISYFISPAAGLATTTAVILHEIPQEIGDFSILVYAGFSRGRAVLFNFLSGLTAIAGALVAIWLQTLVSGLTQIITAFAIGGFIYIATADLMPELKKEVEFPELVKQFIGIISGIGVMAALLLLE